ncbi:MAG: 7-carboxy-7-deazaguanine synthase QueE [Armatimonadota bacterium]
MVVTGTRAAVHEIFSGIQGEGVLVGVRQVFVRFHGCLLHCRYCDTRAGCGTPPATCSAEQMAGRRDELSLPNPLTAEDIVAAVRRLQEGYPHHSVSLTGGEPLHQRPLLDELLPALHTAGLPSYLETNGQLPHELAALRDMPRYLAMDFKLPSLVEGGVAWEPQAEFLDTALARMPLEAIQVKIVFGAACREEVEHAARIIAARRRDIACVLQPLTRRPSGPPPPSPRAVLEAQRVAAGYLDDVRVIPQTHVMIGQR